MPDPDLKKFVELVRGVVKEEIKPVADKVSSLDEKVSGLDEKVESIREQVSYLTEKVDGEIIPTLEAHTKYFKKLTDSQEKDEDNIGRLDKRVSETEAKLGIKAPPEYQIIK